MKHYELTYLITPDFSEEELKNFSEKINNFVLEENGALGDSLKPVRKQLGYPIKKQKEAFLATICFSFQPTADKPKAGNPENLADLEKKLKSENQILRYIILTKKTIKRGPTLRKKRLERISPTPAIEEKPLVKKPTKVELKDIDKKIEEILNE